MARLRHPLGAWRLVDDVGADRRDRQRRTADRWPDTRRRVSSVRTESVSKSPEVRRRFTLSSLSGFGSNLILWTELHEFYKFDYTSTV